MVVEFVSAHQPAPIADLERWRAITDDAARLKAFENITRKPAANSRSRTMVPEANWLARTPNPTRGRPVHHPLNWDG